MSALHKSDIDDIHVKTDVFKNFLTICTHANVMQPSLSEIISKYFIWYAEVSQQLWTHGYMTYYHDMTLFHNIYHKQEKFHWAKLSRYSHCFDFPSNSFVVQDYVVI